MLIHSRARKLERSISPLPKSIHTEIVCRRTKPHPSFIKDLVGHFTDPSLGFVQTPHDYRAWTENTYLEMCYFEYKAFFHTIMVALNEQSCALTVGTMCLVRLSALRDAGGWSTWCVTEDSELAIRIHDAGYRSVYVAAAYGFGLVPERFVDYAKQRYRWIAGPVQEFFYHFARFVGRPGSRQNLSITQRIHHANHGVGSMLFGLQIPLIALSTLAVGSMVWHEEGVPVPYALWLSVTIGVISHILMQWLIYTSVVGASVRQMLLALLANKALTLTMQLASLKTMFNKDQPWLRTNKFKHAQTVRGALAAARLEILAGVSLILFAATAFAQMPYPGLLSMLVLGLVFKGGEYLTTPMVALISVYSQMQSAK